MCFAKLGEHVLESVCQQQADVRNNDCQTQKLASEICRRELHEYITRNVFVISTDILFIKDLLKTAFIIIQQPCVTYQQSKGIVYTKCTSL